MGQVEMAACSWPPTAEKLKPKNGATLKMTLVAQDGLAVVVHPSNPLDNLNILQFRGLFQGRILDWRELGGRLGDVLVISREDGSGSRAAFESLVMDRRPVTLAAIVMPSSQDVIDYVGSHPLAIGYVSMGDLASRVKALTVEGVEPTPQPGKEGSSPLSGPARAGRAGLSGFRLRSHRPGPDQGPIWDNKAGMKAEG
jgi:phosphate transport system substrate-binding protein